MFKQPDPQRIAVTMQQYINANKSPKLLFYDFCNSGSIEGNFLSSKVMENKAVLRVITSPQGRAWIKNNIDDFLNYLAYLSK
jgi:hypothetical protein